MNIGRQVFKEIDRATWKPSTQIADCIAPGPWDLVHNLVRFEVESLTWQHTTFIRRRIQLQLRKWFS